MTNETDVRAEIVALSRQLGDPARRFAVLAEGNTSVRTPSGTMLVKASGASLQKCGENDFVELDLELVLTRLASDDATVDAGRQILAEAGVAEDQPVASVEALLHAVCLSHHSVRVVGHTHPDAVLAILCSDQAQRLIDAPLFPDQVVVLGLHPLLVPYVDPGLPLALVVQRELRLHVSRFGALPRVIYLRNHGMFALGAEPDEVLAITTMAQKAAHVILSAQMAGSLVPLSKEQANGIDTRPDEVHRRKLLAAQPTRRKADGSMSAQLPKETP